MTTLETVHVHLDGVETGVSKVGCFIMILLQQTALNLVPMVALVYLITHVSVQNSGRVSTVMYQVSWLALKKFYTKFLFANTFLHLKFLCCRSNKYMPFSVLKLYNLFLR